MIIAVLLAVLMFTSTSSASFLFSEGSIYERLPENSPLKTMLDRLYQVAYNNDDDVALDVEEDDETDDEDDGEYDDGEHDDDDLDDGPEEDLLLPKIWNMDGEITPYEGNYTDEGDDENITNTIDHPDGDDGGVVWNNVTVDSDVDGEITPDDGNEPVDNSEEIPNTIDIPDGDVGVASNETTVIPDYVDEGEWTVKLERFVEIVMELDGDIGALLQRVVERTFATGTTDSGGTVENDVVDDIVLTAGDQ